MVQAFEITSPLKKFKSFNETFPYCAFALAFSLLYPNKYNSRRKFIAFGIVCLLNSVILFWFLMYLFKCIYKLDVFNLSRNLTIGVIATFFFFKFFYVCHKTEKFADLLKTITDDLSDGNDMEDDCQEIYDHYIKLGQLGQKCWIFIPILLSSQFPIYAGGGMIYDSLVSDIWTKRMVHEMELKFIEDRQYDTPYFELMFAYNLMQCVVLSPNFAGFDGSFCIATTHLRLKMKLMTHKIHKAFKQSKDTFELMRKLKDAVKDHQAVLTFYKNLQDVYGGWLFVVFLLSSLLISMNVYQMYLSNTIEPKYTVFAISGVIHMFTPCYFASNVIKSSEEMSIDIYNAPWEDWAEPKVTRHLIFMMAKAQKTLKLTGMGMAIFNMKLFISVLHTSYSFFTLICSRPTRPYSPWNERISAI